MAEIVNAPESLEVGGKLYHDKMGVEIFNQRIRRDAKRQLEQEDRDVAAEGFSGEMRLMYDPLPTDVPELIPGLLPESGITGIIGETETGKTTLSLEIGASLLTGEPLWGSLVPIRTVDKVVYILGEHTASTAQGLYHRLKLPHSGKFHLIDPPMLHPYKALVIGGVQQQIAIDRLLKWSEGAGLIVFDPLGGFAQGLSTENDSSSMRTLIDSMSLIAQKTGAACIINAHQGKPRMDETGVEIRRTTYAARGSSAIEDAMTHIFYLRRAMQVKQQSTHEERYDLSIRKFKGNPSSDVFKLSRDPETKRNTLINAKTSKSNYPTRDEVQEYRRKIQRILENNPGFEPDTALKMISDSEGLPMATLERWLLTA